MIKTTLIVINPADAARGMPSDTTWACTDCGWAQSEPYTYGGKAEAFQHIKDTLDPKRGVGHWVACVKPNEHGVLEIYSGRNKW